MSVSDEDDDTRESGSGRVGLIRAVVSNPPLPHFSSTHLSTRLSSLSSPYASRGWAEEGWAGPRHLLPPPIPPTHLRPGGPPARDGMEGEGEQRETEPDMMERAGWQES